MATAIPEKLHQDKPFVQAEGELTQAQLEAIADGLMKLTILHTSFKEKLMAKQKQDKFTAGATPEKPRPQQLFIQVEGELTEEQLEAISKRSAFGSAQQAGKLFNNPPFIPVSRKNLCRAQKREKFTATATLEKIRPEKPFFQVEGELTPSTTPRRSLSRSAERQRAAGGLPLN